MMDREEYRRAFDQLSFSPDFQSRTEALLRRHARELEKEKLTMHFKKTRKMAALIAASVAVLAVSVSAAVGWLSPSRVAELMHEPALAEAFRSEDAVLLDERKNIGEYTVGLLGLVSGENLSAFENGLEEDHTYVVTSLTRTDGAPLDQEDFEPFTWTVTPLVEGCRVSAVNNWTLGASAHCLAVDGVAYYIMDIQNLGMFADRTVYLAVYEGGAPSTDQFSMTKEGGISLRPGVTGALFTLPLDERLADPAAAQAFLDSTGMDYTPITDEDLAALEAEVPAVTAAEKDGGKLITVTEAE